jgi:hypothetical protein
MRTNASGQGGGALFAIPSRIAPGSGLRCGLLPREAAATSLSIYIYFFVLSKVRLGLDHLGVATDKVGVSGARPPSCGEVEKLCRRALAFPPMNP